MVAKLNNEIFTYGHYLEWPQDERWELIDGHAYDMSPAPSRLHQEILGEMYRQISNFLVEKECKAYPAPFDVRLPEGNEKEEEIKTVLQPDISIICDKWKLDRKGCLGAPDMVVEIISPATVEKDMREKLYTYERFGVKEYWIVHPIDRIVMIFKLDSTKKYGRPETYSFKEKVPVKSLPGLSIDLSSLPEKQ